MQEQNKQIKDIDVLSLPPRSERGEQGNLREKDELPSRSELKEEKKRVEKNIRSRYRLAKILLYLFIPIPFVFVLYTYNPDFFAVFSRETASSGSAFETVRIARAGNEEATQNDDQQSDSEAPKEESKTEDNTKEDANKYIYHIVEEGDTLYSISMEYFGSRNGERVIREVNELSSGKLEPGQQIKIPKESLE